MPQEVFQQRLLLLAFIFFGAEADVQTHDDGSHQPAFPIVPHEFRQITQYGLEKQYETDPLIVSVVLFGVFVAEIVVDARVSDLDADLTPERVRHGERGRDPTVRVDWMRRQAAHYALDRITDELGGGDD